VTKGCKFTNFLRA